MRARLLTTFIFLLLLTINLSEAFSQSNSINSLQNFVKSINNDTARVLTLIELSKKYQTSEPDKSFNYGLDALLLSTHLDFKEGRGKAHNNLGDLYWYKSDFTSSEDHYNEALKIFESLNDSAHIADCYRNIGWIWNNKEDFLQALSYHAMALDINKKLHSEFELCNDYNDVALNFASLNIFDSAMHYFCIALELEEKLDNEDGLFTSYANISEIYLKLGSAWQSVDYALKALKIAEEIGNIRSQAFIYQSISKTYLIEKNYDASIKALENSVMLTKQFGDKGLLADLYKEMAKVYAAWGNHQNALSFVELSLAFKDTLFEESNIRQQNEMNAKYETSKRVLAINSLLKDKKLSEEKILHEKRFKVYLIIFCIIIVVFAVILYWNYSQKHKANQALQNASHEIEEKNKSITDSIHYARHIQDVCLPAQDLKYKIFSKIFIFFKPKDIVSGDFYWYTEKDGKRLIACCDCTGHGVPGALMSMIGNNILNKIVNERGITSPDEILRSLHKEIRNTLKQEEKTASKDGMDIAIVVFNSDTEIEFAGAHRPLWIVKPNTKGEKGNEKVAIQQYELVEIKPDKLSIGGYQSETERMFTKHKLQLTKGDSLYLFSDGYTDQFGGEKEKKYTSRRFKELLINISNRPVNEQEVVLKETINSWKGSLGQVDDILVIGIKI